MRRTPARRSTNSARRRRSYKALKKALAELRGKTGSGGVQIAGRAGAQARAQEAADGRCARAAVARAARARRRCGRSATYDAKLAEAVKKFQKGADLPATGNLDSQDRQGAQRPAARASKIDIIIANMERWRWYPRDLGKAYSMVNQPGLHAARSCKDGATRLDHAGRDRQAEHGDAAAQRDDEIHHGQSDLERAAVDRAQRISAGAGAGSDRARAHGPQGRHTTATAACTSISRRARSNALGRIRFNFPNRFLVYQHDTPDKHSVRARRARLQPRLHARAGSGEIRRGAARHRAAERGLHRGAHQAHVRLGRDTTSSSSRRRSRSTSPIRPRSSTTPASCRFAATSTASTAA